MYLNKHYHNPIHTFRKNSRLQAQSSVFLRDIEFLYAIDLKMTELTFTFEGGKSFSFNLSLSIKSTSCIRTRNLKVIRWKLYQKQ